MATRRPARFLAARSSSSNVVLGESTRAILHRDAPAGSAWDRTNQAAKGRPTGTERLLAWLAANDESCVDQQVPLRPRWRQAGRVKASPTLPAPLHSRRSSASGDERAVRRTATRQLARGLTKDSQKLHNRAFKWSSLGAIDHTLIVSPAARLAKQFAGEPPGLPQQELNSRACAS